MLSDIRERLDSSQDEGGLTIDLDEIAEKLEGLKSEVDSYRENLVRHIDARRDLLSKSGCLDDLHLSIQQLLEIKESLDGEFRERFRITDGIFDRQRLSGDRFEDTRLYLSGR